MRHRAMIWSTTVFLAAVLLGPRPVPGASQDALDKFVRLSGPVSTDAADPAPIEYRGRFSGYTNFWQTSAWSWHQHGNLFLIGQPDVAQAIAQNKADIAEELGLPGLVLDEGFLEAWLRSGPAEIMDPDSGALSAALERGDVLVWLETGSPLGGKLLRKAPGLLTERTALGSHQSRSGDFRQLAAFALAAGDRRLFAVVSDGTGGRSRFKELLAGVRATVRRYDLHRGWFGTGTLLHSVTCHPGHPLEVIGQGLGQGNDWFTFSGYMDFLHADGAPGLAGPGRPRRYRRRRRHGQGHRTAWAPWPTVCGATTDLKIQDMPTEEEWIRFVKDRGGRIFRPVFAPECDKFAYDGQIAIDGNKKQIDTEDVPFVLPTGLIKEEPPAAMVLFAEKGRRFGRDEMWRAILDRRAVGVLPPGRMMGPAPYRNVLQMLLLDRVFLENLFGDRVRLEATVEGYDLRVRLANFGAAALEGQIVVRPAPGVSVGTKAAEVKLPPGTEQAFSFALTPSAAAMGAVQPVLVEARWKDGRKRTLAVLDLPPAVSVHKLLYGTAPEVTYPRFCPQLYEVIALSGRGQGLRQGPAGGACARDGSDGRGRDRRTPATRVQAAPPARLLYGQDDRIRDLERRPSSASARRPGRSR